MDQANYSFRVIWSDEDEAYVATCPELPGISALDARPDVALREAGNALALALETYAAEGWDAPAPSKIGGHSGQFRLRIPRTLHEQLAQYAEDEGVSLNALATALLAEGIGRRASSGRATGKLTLRKRGA
jgi:antitoxin HicB